MALKPMREHNKLSIRGFKILGFRDDLLPVDLFVV
jgi:hypothetical protein